jgi:uncharacterized OB-fold protein
MGRLLLTNSRLVQKSLGSQFILVSGLGRQVDLSIWCSGHAKSRKSLHSITPVGESLIDLETMNHISTPSPGQVFKDHCRQGQLAYQATDLGQVVFYPRVCAPQTGDELHWKISKGLGTVYSCTEVFVKDREPYNVSLIDVDEGFRMMSRVDGLAAKDVKIGLRVQVKMDMTHPEDPLPVFVPLDALGTGASHE